MGALAATVLVGCGSDDSAGPDDFEPVAPQIVNGATQATATSYWVGNFSTSGYYLIVQIFENGTGRLSYNNDLFQPPAGLTTRNLYDFTWTESATGLTLSYSGATATFTGFANIAAETSFDVVFSDGTNINEDFTFTSLPLGMGADPPL